MKSREKSNRLGGSVDLGLLPRILKGLQVLVARMGDLVLSSFANNGGEIVETAVTTGGGRRLFISLLDFQPLGSTNLEVFDL
jgi:hypothetical protein